MTVEQQETLEKARDCAGGARVLAGSGYYDLAAGRAYYAMFHVARMFLLEHGMNFSKHSSILSAFGQHFIKTGILPAHFHRYLINAQDKRLTGDYQTSIHVPAEEVAVLIEQAEEFIQLAETHLAKVPLSLSDANQPDE